jgi:UDP-2-acetamido-3-amino-2,3-dideoxy-glucuronate N-acetyltransferase
MRKVLFFGMVMMNFSRFSLIGAAGYVGANSTIVCGATLGQYCFICADAVVVGDVPPFAMMAGVPTKRIGWMSKAGSKLGEDSVGPINGNRYRETSIDKLEEIN